MPKPNKVKHSFAFHEAFNLASLLNTGELKELIVRLMDELARKKEHRPRSDVVCAFNAAGYLGIDELEALIVALVGKLPKDEVKKNEQRKPVRK